MANKNEVTPKDYDRWGKLGVKFNNDAPQKEVKTPKKVVKTAKKGK